MEQSHPLGKFSPKNPKNLESQTPNFDEERHKHIMDNLKGTIFTTLSASNASRPITQELKCRIERRLHEFFPRFGIPSHPAYSLMIWTAIRELNEEGGSFAESISGFIEKNYEGLPWGHVTFLHHHLGKVCRMGEIVRKNDGRYMIAVDQGQVKEECRVKGKENEMINECNGEREKQVVVFEGKNEALRPDREAVEQEKERPSAKFYDEEEKQNPLIEMNDELSLLQEPQFEVSDKHALACVQQDLVIVEQNIPKELHVEVIHEKENEDQAKELCVELAKKKTEFQERMMKNSHSLGGIELAKYDPRKPMMVEEMKDDLEMEEKQQARTRCPERASDVEVIEGEKHLPEHEHGFIREESPPLGSSKPVMEEVRKDDLELDELKRTRSPSTKSASDVEVIEGEKQLQERYIEGETEVLGLCCFNKEDLGRNLWASLGDCSVPMLKRQRKQFSNCRQQQQQQLLQQRRSIWEENKFVIVCGLQAQQLSKPKVYGQQNSPHSHPNKKQQHESQDTTMSVLLPSDHHHHQQQQQQQQQLECRGGERPFIRKCDGDHYRTLHCYVRRRRRA